MVLLCFFHLLGESSITLVLECSLYLLLCEQCRFYVLAFRGIFHYLGTGLYFLRVINVGFMCLSMELSYMFPSYKMAALFSMQHIDMLMIQTFD